MFKKKRKKRRKMKNTMKKEGEKVNQVKGKRKGSKTRESESMQHLPAQRDSSCPWRQFVVLSQTLTWFRQMTIEPGTSQYVRFFCSQSSHSFPSTTEIGKKSGCWVIGTLFLDASSNLYNRVCPSVRMLVR